MTLREKQSLFTKLICQHTLWLYRQGYEVTDGDCYRDKRCPYGSERSYHHKRLARDLNLFKDGAYLRSTEAHRFSGEKWESRHPLCVWGGHWMDGNHYSFGEK